MKKHRNNVLHNVSIKDIVTELQTRIKRNVEIFGKAYNSNRKVNIRCYPSDSLYLFEEATVTSFSELVVHFNNYYGKPCHIEMEKVEGVQIIK